MLGKRRLTVATVAVVAGAGWAVFIAPSSQVAAAPAKGDTVRASLIDGSPGDQAPEGGSQSVISGNARYDAFVSRSDLDPNIQPNHGWQQVFVRDLAKDRTVQISVETDDGLTTGGGDRDSRWPSISASGRYVSFVTESTNIGGGKSDGTELVVVCDRDPDGDGTLDEPVSASDPQADIACVGISEFSQITSPPRISADGSILVWGIPGNNDNTFDTVEVASVLDGGGNVTKPDDVKQLSTDTTIGTANLEDPALSADGRNVVYTARQAFEGSVTGIFRTALAADGAPGTTTRVDWDTANEGSWIGTDEVRVSQPATSGDGAIIAFTAKGVSAGSLSVVYVVQPDAGASTVELTLKPTGNPHEDAFGDGAQPAVSADGRYIAFVTDQADMIDAAPPSGSPPNRTCLDPRGDNITANTVPCQVVVRDFSDYDTAYFGGSPDGIGFAQLASVSIRSDCGAGAGTACDGDFDSGSPSLSQHGEKVGFDSFADDLSTNPDDTNIDCDSNCEEECDVPSCGTPVEDAFARTWTPSLRTPDLKVGKIHVGAGKTFSYTITATGFGPQVIKQVYIGATTGGISVDDTGCTGGSGDGALLYQGQSCTVTVIVAPTGVGPIQADLYVQTDGLPPDPAHITGTALPALPSKIRDIVRTSVGSGDPGTQGDTGAACNGDSRVCIGSSMVSGNGRWDVFASKDPLDGSPTRGFENIFVRNVRTNTTQRITFAGTGDSEGPSRPTGQPADGDSFEPSISANGRFVSFVTEASNIVPTETGENETFDTVVVCDRDPDGDGVFDEPQSDSTVPDFSCIYVHSQLFNYSHDQQPRLSPDGRHLVYVACASIDNSECFGNMTVNLVSLPHPRGGGLTGTADATTIGSDALGDDADRSKPQVSNEGRFNGEQGVRVVYAGFYSFFDEEAGYVYRTGVFASDVPDGATVAPRTYRIDRNPNGRGFIGDTPDDEYAPLGNPSMTDDGSKVAFDRQDFFGLDQIYVANVGPKHTATTQIQATTRNKAAVRGADPALSGDGRYLSYVTDTPNFDDAKQSAPSLSCLVNSQDGFAARAVDGANCQIVARDLVLDRQRAKAGLDPLPDALVTESLDQTCGSSPTVFGNTCGGDDYSIDPSMSRTGAEVGFDSYADDLVPKDTNGANDDSPGRHGLDAFVRTFYPTATLSPVDFGNVPVGSSSSQMGTITVTGFGPYQLATATVGGSNPGDFTVTGGTCALPGQLLHLGETCSLTFTFTPGANGPRSATVTVSGDNNPNTTTITVTGNGQESTSAMFSADPDPVNFGSGLPLDRPGRVRKVTITNGGGQTLQISQISVIDGPVAKTARDYTVDSTACGFALAPGASCKIKITWVGHAIGKRPAILRIVDNAPGGTQMIRLRAFVPTPSIDFTPSVVPTGRLTSVEGHGFAPRRLILITLPDSGETATGRTTRHGNFATPLILFPNGILGHRVVQAHSVHSDKSITAEKRLLVVLGTLQSPTLVIRH